MTLVPRFLSRLRPLSQVLSLVALLGLISINSSVFAQTASYKPDPNAHVYTIVQAPDGSTLCRDATEQEKQAMVNSSAQMPELHQINHLKNTGKTGPSAEVNDGSLPGLKIFLFATAQLESFPDAKAAFIRAAADWESRIKSPVTIYLNVDYGPKNFGQNWSSPSVIGATRTLGLTTNYSSVRSNLILTQSNGAETGLYSLLPGSAIATDAGSSDTMLVNVSLARALGFLDANADLSNARQRIGFNSAFQFDFNPADGISPNLTDFQSVATHEIGHALGFDTTNGEGGAPPRLALWDLFRFRPGVSDFTNTLRITTIGGGAQIFYAGGAELGLSTGGPSGVTTGGGDGEQSSHWKADEKSGIYIGIMDPTIGAGDHEDITANDVNALNFMGYNMEANTAPPAVPPPPPPPANNDFASAQVISGCSGSVNGTNISANKESGEPSHSPDSNPGGASVWYRWQSPSTGSVTITTAGSNFDTLLAVYTGTSVSSLTLIGRNDDASTTPHVVSSSVTFNATAGTTYRIAVDGYDNDSGGDTGNIVLNWNASNCTATTPTTVQFSASSYTVNESESFATITVTRTGSDLTGPATVKYATSDSTDVNFRCDPNTAGQATGIASRKCDYHIAVGKLRFAPGETTKQIILSIINDVYVEGPETLTLTLSNPSGATLGTNNAVPVTITSDDTALTANPIDNTRFYVRQLYVDLLSREPDPAGWNGWTSRIDLCGQPDQAPPPCDRVTVGGDGFLRSGEFFDRQFFVLRLYRTGLGRILRYDEVGDLALVSGFLTDTDLELNKQDLVADFITRPEFTNLYNGLNNTAFVDALLQTAGVATAMPADVRLGWITSLGNSSKTRAQVFREISERPEVSAKYAHEAQVVSAYYGFFTRNPDGAYLNYLQRLDSGEINLGDLANAFINAAEYRSRFGQ
jgi:hypothetical protein